MKISATVVTRNESLNIERCLKSLFFCNEIIVVDSHSSDNTAALAKKYTKKIFSADFTGFSAVKNLAIDKTGNPWILSVDADEEISPALRDKIINAVGSKNAINGYMIKRSDFFLGRLIRHGGWDRDYQLRLFRKGSGRFDGKKVHESVVIEGAVGKIDEPILHYSYPDSRTYFDKMNRYTSMQAAEKEVILPLLSMCFAPFFKFFKMYIIKAGFLDGKQGFILGVYSGFSEFVKFAKMAFIKRENKSGGRLLIKAPNWIGDAVMMTAYLKELMRVYPEIYVVCANTGVSEILSGNPHIKRVIQYDRRSIFSTFSAAREIRKEKISTGASLSPSLSSYLILLASGIKIRAGYAADLGRIFLNRVYDGDKSHKKEHVMDQYKRIFYLLDNSFDFSGAKQEIFTGIGVVKRKKTRGMRRILVAPFAKFGPSKMWPLDNYIELIKGLLKDRKKTAVYVTGLKEDMEFNLGEEITGAKNFVDMRGSTLKQTVEAAKNADFFIGNDSGIMHIADAFGVNMAVIFGSTFPGWGGPVNSRAEIFYSGLDCQPCFEKKCRFGHYNCLKKITPANVLKKIKF